MNDISHFAEFEGPPGAKHASGGRISSDYCWPVQGSTEMKIFLSSTYCDLKNYREAIFHSLRKMGHEVVCMEDYVASDSRPVDKCRDDVVASDIYVGLFAWRYGAVPEDDNPERLSVTELEYRAAVAAKKTCLIFLIDPSVPWPTNWIDGVTHEGEGGRSIERLRKNLSKNHLVGFFDSPDQLATAVVLAVRRCELKSSIEGSSLRSVADTHYWGNRNSSMLGSAPIESSHMPAIIHSVLKKDIDAVEIDIEKARSWWSTRVFLVAALLCDFGCAKLIVFLESDAPQFIGMATPLSVRDTFAKVHPQLPEVYQLSRDKGIHSQAKRKQAPVWSVVWETAMEFERQLGRWGGEEHVKFWVKRRDLRHWMGEKLINEYVECDADPVPAWVLYKIITNKSPLVALIQDGRFDAIVDRAELAVQLSRTSLERELLGL